MSTHHDTRHHPKPSSRSTQEASMNRSRPTIQPPTALRATALSLTAAFVLAACGGPQPLQSAPDTTPPGVPQGFAASAGNGQVNLSWTANAESDLNGYVISWGSSADALSNTVEATKTDTSKVVGGLSNGSTYFFAISAKDTSGNASNKSDPSVASPFVPDTTAPTLASSTPANGSSGAGVGANLVLTFSEAMNPGSVTAALVPAVDLGTASWNPEGTVLTFDPPTDLDASTAYALTLNGQDSAGNAMTPANVNFTTGALPDATAPTVLGSSPASGATGVPVNTNISFTFSEAMNRSTVEAAFSGAGITCAWAWTSDSTLATCNPTANLSFSTVYNVSIGTGAKDEAGNALAGAFNSSFTTASAPDTTAPSITGSAPADNAVGLAQKPSITVNFSESMDRATAQAAFQIVNPAGVTGTFNWNGASTKMTFAINTLLPYGQTVEWKLNSNTAEDLAGNKSGGLFFQNFRVIRQKTVSLQSVASVDGVATNAGGAYSSVFGLGLIGDDSSNTVWRTFLNFDLTQLATDGSTKINSATLSVRVLGKAGSPQAELGSLTATHVNYGPTLTSGDFETASLGDCGAFFLGTLSPNTDTNGFKQLAVTKCVDSDYDNRVARSNRSQFRLKFPTSFSNDGNNDYILIGIGESAATDRPTLQVTYEYP